MSNESISEDGPLVGTSNNRLNDSLENVDDDAFQEHASPIKKGRGKAKIYKEEEKFDNLDQAKVILVGMSIFLETLLYRKLLSET